MADADLFALTGGVKDGEGLVPTPCRIFHSEIPAEHDEKYGQPEDVEPLLLIEVDGDVDAVAPIVEGTADMTCWAATHEEAQALAAAVCRVLEAIDREECGGVYVSHLSQAAAAQNQIDVETLRRFTEIEFDFMMCE